MTWDFAFPSVTVGRKLLLKNVRFSVAKSAVCHLEGANGIGKSTLLETLVKSLHKSVSYGYLPQLASKYSKLNLQLGDICDSPHTFYPASLMQKSWHNASGGEQKKALLARALKQGRELIILDEPFNHLDSTSSSLVVKELERKLQSGCTIIYTGHHQMFAQMQSIKVGQWKL